MPSLEHEELVELFSRDPALALHLATASGQLTLPAYDSLELAPAEVARAAWAGIADFGEDERVVWLQILLSGLNEAAQRALEAMLNLDEMKEQTVFFRDGLARGLADGKAEGKAEGLRVAVADLCEALGVEMDERRRRQLEELDLGGLEQLRAHLKQQRAWPQ